jgi:FAD/FMN-containing dehydrogenase
MGGALLDFTEDSAAFSRAGAHWMYEITAQWDSPTSDEEYMSWVDTLGKKLGPHTLSNGYINLNPYRGPAGLQALYGSPEKWQRIVKLKQNWDPNNRLCHNKNITPRIAASARAGPRRGSDRV